MTIRDDLQRLGEEIRDDFVQNRRVMSFAEYLELAAGRPRHQLRAAPQYIRDCFDHYGAEQAEYPWGPSRRFKLFDCPWADGRDRLVGHEEVQNRIYRALTNFVNEGVSNKLVLLHGPNGSAKSTMVRCMGRALQHYSTLDAGALYRINWIFPGQKIAKTGIGFSGTKFDEHSSGDTYAYLPDELTLAGRELYVSVPNGQGRSKLMEALTKRRMPTTATVRNWRTVEALAERCAAENEERPG